MNFNLKAYKIIGIRTNKTVNFRVKGGLNIIAENKDKAEDVFKQKCSVIEPFYLEWEEPFSEIEIDIIESKELDISEIFEDDTKMSGTFPLVGGERFGNAVGSWKEIIESFVNNDRAPRFRTIYVGNGKQGMIFYYLSEYENPKKGQQQIGCLKGKSTVKDTKGGI